LNNGLEKQGERDLITIPVFKGVIDKYGVEKAPSGYPVRGFLM
jgi:hypothetical protein